MRQIYFTSVTGGVWLHLFLCSNHCLFCSIFLGEAGPQGWSATASLGYKMSND